MHYLKLIIVRAEDADDAEDKVNIFMDGYENEVYDWYEIGGRWEGYLKGMEIAPLNEVIDILQEKIKTHKEDTQALKDEVIGILSQSETNFSQAYKILELGERLVGNFSNETVVYNAVDYKANTIPTDTNNCFVVVVDNHN